MSSFRPALMAILLFISICQSSGNLLVKPGKPVAILIIWVNRCGEQQGRCRHLFCAAPLEKILYFVLSHLTLITRGGHPWSHPWCCAWAVTCGGRGAGGDGTLWLKAFALCGDWMKNSVSSGTHFPDVPCKRQSSRQRAV